MAPDRDRPPSEAPGPRSGPPAAARFVAVYRELWLGAAGVLAVVALPRLLGADDGGGYWRLATLVALVVLPLNGVLTWMLRRRQQRRRQAVIAGISATLRDRVNSDLAVIALHLPDIVPASTRGRIDDMLRAVRSISQRLEGLAGEVPATVSDGASGDGGASGGAAADVASPVARRAVAHR